MHRLPTCLLRNVCARLPGFLACPSAPLFGLFSSVAVHSVVPCSRAPCLRTLSFPSSRYVHARLWAPGRGLYRLLHCFRFLLGCRAANVLASCFMPQVTIVSDHVGVGYLALAFGVLPPHPPLGTLAYVLLWLLPGCLCRLVGGSCKAGTEAVAAAEAETASTKLVSVSLLEYVCSVCLIGSESQQWGGDGIAPLAW